VQIARETGYFDGLRDFQPMEAYSYLAPNKIVALCTGSQGEPRAALARIAEEQHPEIKFSRGDRVIYSARTIPGNEKAVGRVINGLIEQGIEVITDRTHLVHVSGHPRRAELEELIGWVKPQIVIPVHGEALVVSNGEPRPVAEILAEIDRQHQRTLKFLAEATPEELRRSVRVEHGEITAEHLVRVPLVAHLEQHVAQLEAALA